MPLARSPLRSAKSLTRAQESVATLQPRCARGDRVLTGARPGLDYIVAFLGCQLTRVVAVPAHPQRNTKQMDRLTAIARGMRCHCGVGGNGSRSQARRGGRAKTNTSSEPARHRILHRAI
jgi:hypothetical protein